MDEQGAKIRREEKIVSRADDEIAKKVSDSFALMDELLQREPILLSFLFSVFLFLSPFSLHL